MSRGLWPFLGRLWVRNGRVSVPVSVLLYLNGHEFRRSKLFIMGLYGLSIRGTEFGSEIYSDGLVHDKDNDVESC
jgi:hypothetical protein